MSLESHANSCGQGVENRTRYEIKNDKTATNPLIVKPGTWKQFEQNYDCDGVIPSMSFGE